MTVPGKYRGAFAVLVTTISVVLLIFGGWIFFTAFGHAMLRAAVGDISSQAHLEDLLFLQTTALTLLVVVGSFLIVAVIALWTSLETQEKNRTEIIRQLKLFSKQDWQESRRAPSGDELDDIAEAVNALARTMREGGPDAKSKSDVEEVKTHFLEIISHQLRTPLTAVRWNLESLLHAEMGPLTKRQQDLLRITSKNYQGILVMLSDWVEALEVERGLLHLNIEPVDLREFIRNMSADFKEQAKLKRQRLVVAIPRGLVKVQADKLKIRYILTKLLSNAMGYTPEGGKVALRLKAGEKNAVIEIEDSGVGIPYDEQPKIFAKFFRASNAALMQPNASGVGLFVTKQLVHAHGGTIAFESEEGKGTKFTVALPMI